MPRPAAGSARGTRRRRGAPRRCAGPRCSSGRRRRRRLRPSRAAAVSTSASAATITGVALPSSRLIFFFGARSLRPQPTPLEPVKVIALTRSSSTSTSPISGGGAGDDVQPARRKARLILELCEEQGRERRGACGLEHHRAPSGERGGELVRDQIEREVERRDRADDADRAAQREAQLALAGLGRIHRHHLAGELARLDRGERVGGHGALGLDPRGLERLPGLVGDLAGHLVVAAAEAHGDLDEDLGTLVRGERLAHRLGGCVDRPLRLCGARLRRRGRRPRPSRASEPRSTRPSRSSRRQPAAFSRRSSRPRGLV